MVAICNLLLVELVEFNCLLKTEQMLWAVVAMQGTGNGLFGVLAAFVPQTSQNLGITLSCNDCLDDPHARHTGYVGYDVVQLQVHLGKGLLHTLDMGRRAPYQSCSLTDICP